MRHFSEISRLKREILVATSVAFLGFFEAHWASFFGQRRHVSRFTTQFIGIFISIKPLYIFYPRFTLYASFFYYGPGCVDSARSLFVIKEDINYTK